MTPSFQTTLKKELLSFRFVSISLLFALLYLCISVIVLNYRFVGDILVANFPILTKLSILFALLGGIWTAQSTTDFLFVTSTAVLVGMNISLALRTVYLLEHKGKVKLSIGGATILGLVTTGCASCGFSVLSILGLSASVSFLPFHGMELHILSIVLLIFSLWYMLRQLHTSVYCKIPKR